jgi:LPS sulfotransferase NodH
MMELCFVSLIKKVEVDEAAFANEISKTTPADRCYIIFFTPHSGSSWLTTVLSATRRLGYPEEYINPEFLPGVIKSTNARTQQQVIQMLKRRRKTPNGVFGIEVRSIDIDLFGEEEFFGEFDSSTVIYYLWRRNLIAQGVSLYRAMTTSRYHSTDKAAVAPPAYGPEVAEGIKHWVQHVAMIENENLRILARRGLAARFLCYEDILRDKSTTVSLFLEPMRVTVEGAQPQSNPDQELRKIDDVWNVNSEEQFRNEERAYVRTIAQQRLILQEPPNSDDA